MEETHANRVDSHHYSGSRQVSHSDLHRLGGEAQSLPSESEAARSSIPTLRHTVRTCIRRCTHGGPRTLSSAHLDHRSACCVHVHVHHLLLVRIVLLSLCALRRWLVVFRVVAAFFIATGRRCRARGTRFRLERTASTDRNLVHGTLGFGRRIRIHRIPRLQPVTVIIDDLQRIRVGL